MVGEGVMIDIGVVVVVVVVFVCGRVRHSTESYRVVIVAKILVIY